MTRIRSEISVAVPMEVMAREVFRVELFPEVMENVEEVRILKREGEIQISHWRINIDGIELQWTEEDRLNLSQGRMEYRLLEGDFVKFEGFWNFHANSHDSSQGHITQVELLVDYDLGLPAFEELIGEMLEIKVRHNSRDLLRALKLRTEQGRGT